LRIQRLNAFIDVIVAAENRRFDDLSNGLDKCANIIRKLKNKYQNKAETINILYQKIYSFILNKTEILEEKISIKLLRLNLLTNEDLLLHL